jgi:hypothetical protein
MPGKEPEDYRPRRAFNGDPASESDPAAGADHAGGDERAGDAGRAGNSDRTDPDRGHDRDRAEDPDGDPYDEDRYDENRDFADGAQDDEGSASIRARADRDRSTTILPSTRDRRRRLSGDTEEMRERGPGLGPRARQLLMVVGVIVVVIAGLLFGYSALRVGRDPVTPRPGGGVTALTAGGSETPAVPVLDDAAMINAEGAAKIDPKRTWQVASTQRGLDSSSPRPACLTGAL